MARESISTLLQSANPYTAMSLNLTPIAESCDPVSPAIDGAYIYFAANGLVRCRLDGSERQILSPKKCAHRPFIDGDYVYFAADGLNRCNKNDGSDWKLIDANCRAAPVVDGDYVYFAGGARGLYRRLKDGSGKAQEIDANCRAAPVVDGDYVYFAGGARGLYRRLKDGSGKAQEIDANCRAAPVVDGDYVYFAGGHDGLYRRLKDGSGHEELLDDHCGEQPITDGEYVYFLGGPGHNGLYRTLKAGEGLAHKLHSECSSSVAVKDGWVYFIAGTTLYRRAIHGNVEAEWMARMWDRIKDTPLWQLAIPHTHDSATYGLYWAGQVEQALQLPMTTLSQDQCANIYEQLMFGYRSFDLRFVPNLRRDPEAPVDLTHYYFHHGSDVTVHTLESVISQVVQFLDRTSREILILNFRADRSEWLKDSVYVHARLTLGEERKLIQEICRRINHSRIVTHSFARSQNKWYPAGFTPGELWNGVTNDRRVILLWWGNNDTVLSVDPLVSDYVWLTGDTENTYFQVGPVAEWMRDRQTIQADSGNKYWYRAGAEEDKDLLRIFEAACKGEAPDVTSFNKFLDLPWNLIGGDFLSEDAYRIGADIVINKMQGRGVL
ncbi:MAG: DUF5050 domain-containing protein [Anaerolineae bacterium]